MPPESIVVGVAFSVCLRGPGRRLGSPSGVRPFLSPLVFYLFIVHTRLWMAEGAAVEPDLRAGNWFFFFLISSLCIQAERTGSAPPESI